MKKVERIPKVCSFCKEDFLAQSSYVRRDGDVKYCSRKCYYRATSKAPGTPKNCWKCSRVLDRTREFFYANSTKGDGLTSECKDCIKTATAAKRNKKRSDFVASKGNACELCGLTHESHMFFDLDHIVPLRNHGAPRVLRDYNKEDLQVLCPNCHRNKTMKDMNWGKYETKN